MLCQAIMKVCALALRVGDHDTEDGHLSLKELLTGSGLCNLTELCMHAVTPGSSTGYVSE